MHDEERDYIRLRATFDSSRSEGSYCEMHGTCRGDCV